MIGEAHLTTFARYTPRSVFISIGVPRGHVLEHVDHLAAALAEIARVLKPAGRVYIAVPNGYGLCDGIYRYLFEGGGHINRFERRALVSLLELSLAVRLTRWKKLYSSFAYLSRVKDLDRAVLPQLPARLRTAARLPSAVLWLLQGALYVLTRFADRAAGVDWALYGWALYLDRIPSPDPAREDSPYINVCLHCGSGHPAHLLGRYHKVLYRCTACDRWGIYFPPFRNGK